MDDGASDVSPCRFHVPKTYTDLALPWHVARSIRAHQCLLVFVVRELLSPSCIGGYFRIPPEISIKKALLSGELIGKVNLQT